MKPDHALGPCTRCGRGEALDANNLRCLPCQRIVEANFDARRVLKIVELLRLEGLPQSALDPVVSWVANHSISRRLSR